MCRFTKALVVLLLVASTMILPAYALYPLLQSTNSQYVYVYMVNSSNQTQAVTGITAPTITVSKNGANLTAVSNGTWAELAGGIYTVELNATDTNTTGPLLVRVVKAGCDDYRVLCSVRAKTEAQVDANALAVGANLTTLTTTVGAAGAGLTALANNTAMGTVLTDLTTIKGYTDDIGAAGVGLTTLANSTALAALTTTVGTAGAGLTALANATAQAAQTVTLGEANTTVNSILVDTAEIGAAGAGLTALANATAQAAQNVTLAAISGYTDDIAGDVWAAAVRTVTGGNTSSTNERGTDSALLASNYVAERGTDNAATAAALALVAGNVTDILTDTAEIGVDGAGLVALAQNTTAADVWTVATREVTGGNTTSINERGTDSALLASNYTPERGTDNAATAANLATLMSRVGAAGENLTGIPAVAAVTGNVGGNVTGSVASVLGNVVGSVGSVLGAVNSITQAVLTTDNANITSIAATSAKLDGILEADGPLWRWTENSLEQAPGGNTSGASAAEVWEYATRTVTGGNVTATSVSDKTGYTVTAGNVTATATGGSVLTDIAAAVWAALARTITGGNATITAIASDVDFSTAQNTTLSGLSVSANLTPVTDMLTAMEGATFNTTTDSLEAIRNRGDAAWVTGAGAGAGAITYVYTLTSTVDAAPIADAHVWVTTDLAGTNIIASGTTNASGQVTFQLDAGNSNYFWRAKTGWTFTNPDQETVVAP